MATQETKPQRLTAIRRAWGAHRTARWLVIGAAVALLGLAGYRAASVLRQRQVVALLSQRPRAEVYYSPPEWEEFSRKAPVRWFRWLGKDWFLAPKGVVIRSPEVCNRDAELAAELSELRSLVLTNGSVRIRDLGFDPYRIPPSRLDDRGALALKRLTRLEILCLSGTQITDAGVPYLGQLTELKRLQLANTKITDATGVLLGSLPKLEAVDLDGTQVGDATLLALANCPALRLVYARDVRATDAGIMRFQSLRPDVYLLASGDGSWLQFEPLAVDQAEGQPAAEATASPSAVRGPE